MATVILGLGLILAYGAAGFYTARMVMASNEVHGKIPPERETSAFIMLAALWRFWLLLMLAAAITADRGDW